MTWPAPLEELDELAREVYTRALTGRGQTLWQVVKRLDDDLAGPQRVSEACRRIVRLGWAEVSVLGYRRRRVVQPSLVGEGATVDTLR